MRLSTSPSRRPLSRWSTCLRRVACMSWGHHMTALCGCCSPAAAGAPWRLVSVRGAQRIAAPPCGLARAGARAGTPQFPLPPAPPPPLPPPPPPLPPQPPLSAAAASSTARNARPLMRRRGPPRCAPPPNLPAAAEGFHAVAVPPAAPPPPPPSRRRHICWWRRHRLAFYYGHGGLPRKRSVSLQALHSI